MSKRGHRRANHARERGEMVERQLVARGIRSAPLLAAMRRVPRELYVSEQLQRSAYDDSPLPIELGQTISQPYVVACMIEALQLSAQARVLEIGTGSGYSTAVLAELVAEVYTIERHERLASSAAQRLSYEGYDNVHGRYADGSLGWPEAMPFDGIVVWACSPWVPEALPKQLAVGGKLVIPVGEEADDQRLKLITRGQADSLDERDLGAVAFVPLIGSQAWRHDPRAPAPSSVPPREPER